MYLALAHVFFYEDILDLKWIFFIHYDARLRHVFDDGSMNMEKNNDGQQNIDEELENIEEMDIHDDVQDEYFEAYKCEVDNDENIPLALGRSIATCASSHND